jgi:hypothetical protein
MVEGLLLAGRRDEAVQLAVEYQHWGLAFMLASVCSPLQYQALSKAFAEKHFSQASPMHLLSLVYSNQARSSIEHGGKSLAVDTMLKPAASEVHAANSKRSMDSKLSFTSPSIWRRNMAALISNKSGDWQAVLRTFGRRLEIEENDISAAHIAYLFAGALPEANSVDSLFSMVGCDPHRLLHRQIADVVSVSSFRMTEIFEWSVQRGVEKTSNAIKQQPSSAVTAASAGVGATMSGLFSGLFKSTSSNDLATGNGRSVDPAAATLKAEDADVTADNIYVSPQDFVVLQASLCPLKLQFATVLADFGLVSEAVAYAKEIKRLMNSLEIKGWHLLCGIYFTVENFRSAPQLAANARPPAGKNQSGKVEVDNNVPRLFKKSHAVALELLMDRLDGDCCCLTESNVVMGCYCRRNESAEVYKQRPASY